MANYKRMILNADGSCSGNPGPASYAVVVREHNVGIVDSFRKDIGDGTSNIAEWHGCIAALAYAIEHELMDVELRMDSLLVVMQLIGQWKVKTPHLAPLRDTAQRKMRILKGRDARVRVQWVRRERNKEADALA